MAALPGRAERVRHVREPEQAAEGVAAGCGCGGGCWRRCRARGCCWPPAGGEASRSARRCWPPGACRRGGWSCCRRPRRRRSTSKGSTGSTSAWTRSPSTASPPPATALWMGVPVVSLAGQTLASRAGVSLLSAVGLGELVAGSEERVHRHRRRPGARTCRDWPRCGGACGTGCSPRRCATAPASPAGCRTPTGSCGGGGRTRERRREGSEDRRCLPRLRRHAERVEYNARRHETSGSVAPANVRTTQ